MPVSSVSDSVSVSKNLNELLVNEGKCHEASSRKMLNPLGIRNVLLKSENIPERRGLVAGTVTDTVTQKSMEVWHD